MAFPPLPPKCEPKYFPYAPMHSVVAKSILSGGLSLVAEPLWTLASWFCGPFPSGVLDSSGSHLYSHQQAKQTFQNATCLLGHRGDKNSITLQSKQKLLLQLLEVSGCFVFLLHSWLPPKVDMCSSPHHPGFALCFIWRLRHRRRIGPRNLVISVSFLACENTDILCPWVLHAFSINSQFNTIVLIYSVCVCVCPCVSVSTHMWRIRNNLSLQRLFSLCFGTETLTAWILLSRLEGLATQTLWFLAMPRFVQGAGLMFWCLCSKHFNWQSYPPGSIKSYYFCNEEPLKDHATFHGQAELLS